MSECKCDMRTKLVGDGCEVCNQDIALDYAKDTIDELQADKVELIEALELIASCDLKYHGDVIDVARKALAKHKG